MTPITFATPSPPKGRSPSFPTTLHVRSNIRSTSISMPSAISWNVASQNSSSSAASQPASKRPPEITVPSSLSQRSSYGCHKCPHHLMGLLPSTPHYSHQPQQQVQADRGCTGPHRSIDPRAPRGRRTMNACPDWSFTLCRPPLNARAQLSASLPNPGRLHGPRWLRGAHRRRGLGRWGGTRRSDVHGDHPLFLAKLRRKN